MYSLWLELLFFLIIILVSAQLFSNALEYFGERIKISSGVTGSVLAAISTALPETSVPLIALFAGSSDPAINQEISVGAILGAPLMLSTLSTCVMAVSLLRKRGIKGKLHPEQSGITRDLNFFLAAFFIAAVAMFVPHHPMYFRGSLSIILIAIYLTYLFRTINASSHLVQNGHGVTPSEKLYFGKIGLKENAKTISLQLLLGLILLLIGAKGFINCTVSVSGSLGISALLLSLIIIPIATELPEKVNSILWVRKNQDTLGFGNITGAMVFQGTLLPALGILLTPWQPSKIVLTGVIITIIAATWIRFNIYKGLNITIFFVNGLLYLLYLAFVIR